MQAPTDTVPGPRPILMRILIRSWEYRRPQLWVRVRFASAVFNTALGVAFIVASPWLGPLALLGVLPLAGAALVFWTARRLQASVQS